MFFLERQVDNLVSIGEDAPTLLAFKGHSGLPQDACWTESNGLLKSYLSAAEQMVDELSGQPLRVRSFKVTFEDLGFHVNRQLRSLKLPVFPITVGSTSVAYVLDNGNTGTYIEGTDYQLYGPRSNSPEIIFPSSFVASSTITTPWPYAVTCQVGPSLSPDINLIAIFELAAYYYRNPEAMGDKSVRPSAVWQAHLDFLKGTFYGTN